MISEKARHLDKILVKARHLDTRATRVIVLSPELHNVAHRLPFFVTTIRTRLPALRSRVPARDGLHRVFG